MSGNLLRKSISGTIITLGVTGLRFMVGFGSQFILARLLLPEDFGAMAFAWMIVGFIGNFTNFQSQKYIIRARSDIKRIVNTSFTFELLLSGLVFLFALAVVPPIMIWLGKSNLTLFVQVLALTLFYHPVLQLRSLLERQLNFGLASIPDIVGITLGAITSIILAYLGYGVWSLVLGVLIQFVTQTISTWIVIPYRPRWELDTKIIKEVTKFGWPLMGASISIFFYWNIDYYMVGELLDERQLGYYWLAFQVTHYMLQAKSALNKIAYAAFCNVDNDTQLSSGFSALTRYTALLFSFPVLIFFLYGEQTITLLFGEKWLPATVPFQIFTLVTFLRATFGYWDAIFTKEGKTRILLLATILNSIILPFLVYLLIRIWGISGAALGVLLTICIVTPILAYRLKKILPVSYLNILYPPSLILIISYAIGAIVKAIIPESFIWGHIMNLVVASILFVLLSLVLIKDMQENIGKIVRAVKVNTFQISEN